MSSDKEGKAAALGVDIGGTKVATGIVDDGGELLFRTEVAMMTSGTADDALDCVHLAIRAALNSTPGRDVSAIGIASPGPLQLPAGMVLDSPNLPCWHEFPLGDKIRATYGIPTFVDNDANAAGLAEALWGAGAEFDSVFYATIGTGIGTALILNRKIYYGHSAFAPEGGHMTIDLHAPCHCACGKRGCLEGMASGPSIARRARERVLTSKYDSATWGDDPQQITTRVVAEAFHSGDALAVEIMNETADLYAVWLGNIIDLVEPAVIVVGGGVGQFVSEWFAYIRQRLPGCSIVPKSECIPLRLARFGTDAGVIGAAALCLAAIDQRPMAQVANN
jgi:glucokinase